MSVSDSLHRQSTPQPEPAATGGTPLCLREVELFDRIPHEELAELNTMLPLTCHAAGQIVYDPQRSKDVLFIVKTGRVRVFQVSPTGKSFTLAVHGAGDVFGNMPILGQNMDNTYAETLEKSSLCELSAQQVTDHFLTDPRISGQVAVILSQRVSELETRLSNMALRPLNQQVASLLLSAATTSRLPWKHTKTVKLTHEQLANLAGASREAVSKAVAELSAHGFLKQHRGSVTIIDADGLAAYRDHLVD
ncbi:Crp/Fnr family transcriptional regulator [Corynebacterium mendelii]|uniref:Crp/Fnr family transcriptional regulator n=1 Tax=Corynebacterium mendelii TaxID=2765362 RepID=A0A939DYV2_9CORY|nr:Crp/Fnr family transcriptional regulator [Corynebacterium mendelii]MBN9643765.1 Crp/Fnr family transcriptional regulator [Corynebacterium mendelii]